MTPWKPWHQVVQLRDDLKSGELSLAMFAADLYDVMMGQAKPIYQKPDEFTKNQMNFLPSLIPHLPCAT